MSDKSIVEEVATGLGMEKNDVAAVLDEFCLQLHRQIYEYNEGNGDYLGEQLWHKVSSQAFYHLLGFVECFAERYQWDPGSAHEYLMRLGPRSEWRPYQHQMDGWKYYKKASS